MLKVLLTYSVILSILIVFIVISHAAEYSNVQNTAVTGVFELDHTVSRSSFFKTMVETAEIKTGGSTKLGRFFVRNNTKDGFELSITSSQKGVMAPTGDSAQGLDGETPISYSIKIEKEGTVGNGIDANYDHATNDLANEVTVLSIAGDSVGSATDAEFSLYVIVEDDDNTMELAGTYSDTLTLTYTDL